MPVNHAKEFLKSLHPEALYSQRFVRTLNFYFRVLVGFSKKIFREESFQMVSSISGLLSLEIWQPYMNPILACLYLKVKEAFKKVTLKKPCWVETYLIRLQKFHPRAFELFSKPNYSQEEKAFKKVNNLEKVMLRHIK